MNKTLIGVICYNRQNFTRLINKMEDYGLDHTNYIPILSNKDLRSRRFDKVYYLDYPLTDIDIELLDCNNIIFDDKEIFRDIGFPLDFWVEECSYSSKRRIYKSIEFDTQLAALRIDFLTKKLDYDKDLKKPKSLKPSWLSL